MTEQDKTIAKLEKMRATLLLHRETAAKALARADEIVAKIDSALVVLHTPVPDEEVKDD